MSHFYLTVVSSLLLVTLTSGLQAAAQGSRLSIPGTGVQIVPPPGLTLTPIGTMLTDEKAETLIVFTIGKREFGCESERSRQGTFPRGPEHLSGVLEGDLYERRRASDGGGWDGWMLCMAHGEKAFQTLATYKGDSAEAFRALKDYLLTITWDPGFAFDTELAMGVGLTPKGLQLDREFLSGLSYKRSWDAGPEGSTLLVPKDTSLAAQAMPVSASQLAEIYPSGCQRLIAAVVADPNFKEPNRVEQKGYSYCEGWGNSVYVAIVRLDSGVLLSIMGTSAESKFDESLPVFREALKTVRIVGNR